MTQELQDLHERIGHEIEELERTVQLAENAWRCETAEKGESVLHVG